MFALKPERGPIALATVLFALRALALWGLGLGDAEALYVVYGSFLQPGYLDHPGLVGVLAWALGTPPQPFVVHLFANCIATAVPFVAAWAAGGFGADPVRRRRVFYAFALVPQLAIGLAALTPDLPLALLWIVGLGAAGRAITTLDEPTASATARWGWPLLAASCAGVAGWCKASGALLGLAFVVAAASHRSLRKPPILVAGLVGLLVWAPLVLWEASEGWPMLTHRFVATQGEAGFGLRNLGALVGGQLLYVGPPFLWGAWMAARTLWRPKTAHERLLAWATAVPAAALIPLCLWSPVAEPHWLAPAYLALGLRWGTTVPLGRRLGRFAWAYGALVVGLGVLAVRTPVLPWLQGERYEPRYDLVNDLYAWGPARAWLQQGLSKTRREEGARVALVAPHWIVCAQAQLAVGSDVPIRCETPVGDDFQRFFWPGATRAVDALLVLDDSRFPATESSSLDGFVEMPPLRTTLDVKRGGHVVRTFRLRAFRPEQPVSAKP